MKYREIIILVIGLSWKRTSKYRRV